MLDRNEGPLANERAGFTILAWTLLVLSGLMLVALVVDGVVPNSDLAPPPIMLAPFVVLLLLTLVAQERYRRRKLEERVAALGAKA